MKFTRTDFVFVPSHTPLSYSCTLTINEHDFPICKKSLHIFINLLVRVGLIDEKSNLCLIHVISADAMAKFTLVNSIRMKTRQSQKSLRAIVINI